jgi:hypothetical protein
MARKEKHIHYLYKTTCLVTNRWYIGMHSTSNLDDGYMGSGKRLRRSINKYGKDNHVREILDFFESRELLIEAEIKAITPEMITDKDCMNLMGGGKGGFISEEHQKHRALCANKALNLKLKTDLEFYNNWKSNISISHKKRCDEGLKPKIICTGWNKGLKLSQNHKDKIGKTNSEKQKGEGNSQYGFMWVHKDNVNKRIKKNEIDNYINLGWIIGKTPSIPSSILILMLEKFKEGVSYEKISVFFGYPKTTVRKNLYKIINK